MDEGFRAAYLEGVEAIERIAARLEPSDWNAPSGCEGWSARDLAGHVLVVASWWHDWLDRAEAGDSEPPFHWNDVPARNDEALAALPPASGPERIARFAERARAYADRVPAAWDLRFGCPPATVSQAEVTVGLHFGLAPAEWHLHAWDLAARHGETYRPAAPEVIFEGLRAVFPIPPLDGDAWDNVLLVSGRTKRTG